MLQKTPSPQSWARNSPCGLNEVSGHVGEAISAANHGQLKNLRMASRWQLAKCWALSCIATGVNSVDSLGWLWGGCSPSRATHENVAQPTLWMQPLQTLSKNQVKSCSDSQPRETEDSKGILFYATKFVVVTQQLLHLTHLLLWNQWTYMTFTFTPSTHSQPGFEYSQK